MGCDCISLKVFLFFFVFFFFFFFFFLQGKVSRLSCPKESYRCTLQSVTVLVVGFHLQW